MDSYQSTFRLKAVVWAIGILLLMIFPLGCAKKALGQYPLISSSRGVALNGYDVIAYYDLKEGDSPIKGRTNYESSYGGANWFFDTAGNASEFIGSPADYMPMYNGYAADVLSFNDELIESNPRYWAFFGNDLYLFRSRNGIERWRQGDWKSYKQRADENFDLFIALKKGG